MFWWQCGFSLALWVAYGIFMAKRSDRVARLVVRMSKGGVVAFGIGTMVASMLVLVGGLALVAQSEGLKPTGLTPSGWLVATLTGLGFVRLQSLGAVAMTIASTRKRASADPNASVSQE